MHKLSTEKRAIIILRLLVEGMSMRSITRTVRCSINTVTKLLDDAGKYLAEFQDETLRNLPHAAGSRRSVGFRVREE